MVVVMVDPSQLLSRTVKQANDCLEWTGGRSQSGYGRVYVNRKAKRAHRVSYETFVGPIPDDLVLDHLCRNRLCINPDHLEPVTTRVNVLRGVAPPAQNSKKTRCKNGHPFDDANTRPRVDAPNGGRRCRTCASDAWRRFEAKRKGRSE